MTLASLNIDKSTSDGPYKQHLSLAAYLQGDVTDLDIIGAPLAKELDLWGLSHCWGSSIPISH